MGTSGPGNIVHIDNLYVKDVPVLSNTKITLGEFVVFLKTENAVRPLIDADAADNAFLNLKNLRILQAGESADNLDTTPVADRKTTCECITKGSDWVVFMRAGAVPDGNVGIIRKDSDIPNKYQVSELSGTGGAIAVENVLGLYKHKEFSTIALVSLQGDNGIVSTGLGTS